MIDLATSACMVPGETLRALRDQEHRITKDAVAIGLMVGADRSGSPAELTASASSPNHVISEFLPFARVIGAFVIHTVSKERSWLA